MFMLYVEMSFTLASNDYIFYPLNFSGNHGRDIIIPREDLKAWVLM
jgi:hypothetical protein